MIPDESHEISKLIAFAKEIVELSGEKALSYYGRGQSDTRFDEGLVTEAEIQITEIFQNLLQERFPAHDVFRNLSTHQTYSHEEKRYLWVFDPLDGIANFQAGIPIWGMSLALLENFWPVLGVFYMPATGDLFHAQAGNYAFRGESRIHCDTMEGIGDESLLLTYSRFHHHYRTSFPGKIRGFGCNTAHLCYVAMGRADAAVIVNESFQGLAAARVLIEAAGGKICGLDGSDFFLNEYLNGQKITDPLLVASPVKCRDILDCLEKVP